MALYFLLTSPLVQALALHDIAPADEQKLRQEMPQIFSTAPNQAQLDDAIRFLTKIGNYESVGFERTGSGEYAIVGHPFSEIEDVEFTGQKSFPVSQLLEITGIKQGEKFDRKKAVAAGEKLKQFYGESGFFNTIINLTFPRGKNKNVILHFEIHENPPCRVASVDLKTSNPVLKRRLMEKIKKSLNQPLTQDVVHKMATTISDYFMDHRYLTAKLIGPEVTYNEDKSSAYISFEIKDSYRWEFFFSGNVYDTQLDIFRAMDWSNRDRRTVEPASEGAERIKQDYIKKGFPQAQVSFDVDTDTKSYVKKVFYQIHEGFRVRLRKIEIQGRISRTPSYYSDFIIDNSTELIQRGYYNRQDLEKGFQNLITQLRNEGYLRARIQSSRIEYDATKKNATVYVLVDEGPVTLVQTVDFQGNHFVSSFELTGVLGLAANSPLHLNELEAGIQRIKNFYQSHGYLEMKILNEGADIVKYNESGTLGRLSFKIYEGPRVRIAAVHVDGNTITKTPVILRAAAFKIGDILTPDEIDGATARLNAMGLFSRVDIHTLEENTSVSNRTVIISVSDREPGLVRFGAGVNDEWDLTAHGYSSLSYNNLGGTGRAVTGRVELSENIPHVNYLESDINVGYLEPFLFDSLTRFRMNVARSQHVFDYATNPNITSITLSNTMTFNLERDFNTHWKGTYKLWGYEETKDFERHGNFPSDLLYVNTTGPILDIDYRDNPFTPSRGSLTKLIAEFASPYLGSSDKIDFIHLEAHESLYFPLKKDSNRWVWANQFRAGYLANLSNQPGSGIPVSHAFFLGGVDTVRGFNYWQDNERIPPGYEVPITEGNQILISSDTHYFLIKTELRFPIYEEHGGVIFYDGGAVYMPDYVISRPYRDSVGFGYRYNTPVGAVSLDIAFKIRPRLAPDPYPEAPVGVHFSIGSF